MGALIGANVHYRDNGVCRAALVLEDSPPSYQVCDLSIFKKGLLNAIITEQRNNVNQDEFNVQTGMVPGTDDTWHERNTCPDA